MGIKTKPIQSPFAPLKDVAEIYLKQALLDIQLNFQKQRIYPTEVYRGYEKVNQYRRKHHMWWSRGDGAKSFEGNVYQANEETGEPRDPAAHNHADKVDRAKKAKFKTRYISKWDRRAGKSHRPAIMRTVRRLKMRYENHLADYYGYQGLLQIINALEGKDE